MEGPMRATWYVLDDGAFVDPNEVAPDDAGVLRHKSGIAVAIGPYGPRSRGVDLSEVAKAAPSAADRQMKAAGGARYKTR